MKEPLQILLIEDNPGDVRLIKEYLKNFTRMSLVLNDVDTLQSGLKFLEQNSVDVVLVDLGLPDSQGLESLVRITSFAPQLPTIVLTGMNDSEIALKAMQNGAQDYLVKGDFSSDSIIRVIQYSIERKQAEEAIRQAENRSNALIENAPDGIALIGMNGKFIFTSPSANRIFGYSDNEAIGDDPAESTHPDDLAMVLSTLSDLVQNPAQIATLEYRFRHKNGSWLWVESTFTNLFAEPSVGAIVINFRDVTDRRQAEQTLQLQSAALEAAANAIIITDANGIIEWVNPAWSTLTGYSAQEALGKKPRMMKSGLHDTQFYENLWDTIQAGKVWHGEMTNRRKDGNLYAEDATITPLLDVNNQITHFIAVLQDITERKQAEEQIRFQANCLEAVEQAVIVTQLDGEIIYWNPFAEKLYGWPAEEAIGRKIVEVTVPQMTQKQGVEIMAKLGAGQGWSGEFNAQHRDGHTFPAFVSDTPIVNEQGELFAIIGISMDITERKQLEIALKDERNLLAQHVRERTAELRHANADLIKALQTKDEFLANMSHELRTPLTAILGISEILEMGMRGPLNEYQANSIRTIYQSGEHLLSLINDILDLSKIEAGKLEIEPGRVLVTDICQASLSIVKGIAFTKDIDLSLHIFDPEVHIWADARRLKQILVNLLSNAVKFTPHGGKVSLNVILDQQQYQLKFIVKDNGIGISKENVDKLFEPFTQLDASLSRKHEGTGLGLALVRKLVELHHGKVFVESEGIPGKGSCFTVVLPWENNPPVKFTTPSIPTETVLPDPKISDADSVSADKEPLVILIVEDSPANMTTMSEYLQAFGYKTIQAQNGIEAVEKANTDLPDLILMDIQMPEMDGLEAIRRLRQDKKFTLTPIFALTALAMPGDRQRCLDAGATDYITKPVQLKELVKKINTCFESTGREN